MSDNPLKPNAPRKGKRATNREGAISLKAAQAKIRATIVVTKKEEPKDGD